jgi:hypothetical protein
VPAARLDSGQAPAREQVLHHALWQHAQHAVAAPAEQLDHLDYRELTDEGLRHIAAGWWTTATHPSGQARNPGKDRARRRAWLAAAELTRRGQQLTTAAVCTVPDPLGAPPAHCTPETSAEGGSAEREALGIPARPDRLDHEHPARWELTSTRLALARQRLQESAARLDAARSQPRQHPLSPEAVEEQTPATAPPPRPTATATWTWASSRRPDQTRHGPTRRGRAGAKTADARRRPARCAHHRLCGAGISA